MAISSLRALRAWRTHTVAVRTTFGCGLGGAPGEGTPADDLTNFCLAFVTNCPLALPPLSISHWGQTRGGASYG